ncbi:MAG: hypothetical protein JWR32_6332 [Mycobacterium sp.]|jgi:hypothetical protein|nr:hypothetical protein [Mycobacterium sp.]
MFTKAPRSAFGGRHRRLPSRGVWRRLAQIAVLMVLAAEISTAATYEQVLGSTGYATWQDMASTMLRQVGLGGLLDQYENWRYTRHPPSDTPPDPRTLGTGGTSVGATPRPADPGPVLPPLVATADNAGWHPVTRVPGSPPLVYTALIEPDPAHHSVVAGVALIRLPGTRAYLMPGTVEPGQTGSPGRIPPAQIPDVVAAFNSGFKMSAAPGGFYLAGTTVQRLVDGKASAVIDDQGHLIIGQWGRDVGMTPFVRAVRQNLSLIVDRGAEYQAWTETPTSGGGLPKTSCNTRGAPGWEPPPTAMWSTSPAINSTCSP